MKPIMTKLYYTPPADKLFDELKKSALEIWGGYDEPYRTEKRDEKFLEVYAEYYE